MRAAALPMWSMLAALAMPAVAAAGPEPFRLVFLDADPGASVRQGAGDSATIDVGRVVARTCGGRACMRTVIQRRFRLRVDGQSSGRFVRVSAFVQHDVPGQRVKLDGRILSTMPQVVDAARPLRMPVAHMLEIEVSASQPEGPLAESIIWIVEDAR
ncbi:MAG TPA: hypothetical protein VM513_32010 [Kofleriaceae bacterium]|jgi:hypothetical protein|nr:hypothetical protein [Kofleriaceae bacterium]